MPPRIERFRASARAEEHMLDKHGVSAEEAAEAAEDAAHYTRVRSSGGSERRYLAAGKTADGRRLWVVLADEGGGQGRIITARGPVGKGDIARHRRLCGG